MAAERACAVTAERWDQSSIALVCQAWSWLRHQPGDATVAALLARARGMLVAGGGGGGGGFSPQNLGTLIVSLGELKRCPDDAWMALFQAAVLARLPEASSKDIGFFLKVSLSLSLRLWEMLVGRMGPRTSLRIRRVVDRSQPPPPKKYRAWPSSTTTRAATRSTRCSRP